MRALGIVAGFLGVGTMVYFLADMATTRSKKEADTRSSVGIEKSVDSLRARRGQRIRQKPHVSTREVSPVVVENEASPNPEDPRAERPVPTEAPDRSAELSSALDAEYASDNKPTRESHERERAIEDLFSKSNLGEAGQLENIVCRESICRGTISISTAQSDREVFEKTFMSLDFARLIPDAVSVASREERSDGTVLATFFIHPQSVFDTIAN